MRLCVEEEPGLLIESIVSSTFASLGTYKNQSGLDFEIPKDQMRFE